MTGVPRLAVQLHTVREPLAEDPAGTLARLAEIGIRAVEPFRVGRGEPAESAENARRMRAQLDAAGLIACSVGVAAPLGDATEQVLDAADEIGADTLIIPTPGAVPGFTPDAYTDLDRTRRLGASLAEAAANAAQRGKRIGFHNHWREFTLLPDGRTAYAVLMAEAGPAVGAEVDVYWAHAAGQSPAELIVGLGDRAWLLHVKDGDGSSKDHQTPLGQGVVDNAAAIRAGTAVGWHVIEFDKFAGDIFDAVAQSAQWLTDAGLTQWGADA